MARTKQTARKSTGGKAPRKSHASKKPARKWNKTSAVRDDDEDDGFTDMSTTGGFSSPPVKRMKKMDESEDDDYLSSRTRRTVINPFTDEVITFLPEKKKRKESPLKYMYEEFGDEISEYDSSFEAVFSSYVNNTGAVTTKKKVAKPAPVMTSVTPAKAMKKSIGGASGNGGGGFGGNFGGASTSSASPGGFVRNTNGGWGTPISSSVVDNSSTLGNLLIPSTAQKAPASPIPSSGTFVWQWLGDRGPNSYETYDDETNDIIELAYNRGEKQLDMNHGFFGRSGGYTIDFNNMTQTKKTTNYVRNIRRVPKSSIIGTKNHSSSGDESDDSWSPSDEDMEDISGSDSDD